MTIHPFKFRVVAVAAALALPMTAVMATNGYFPPGSGVKAMATGGASVAMTDNPFAGVNHPAWAGNRGEVGMGLFMPDRYMNRSGSFTLDSSADSQKNLFLIPELGYNQAVSDRMGVGIAVYGNGGMNADYPGGQIPVANCGQGNVGVDLMQLIVFPTIAYKRNDAHSFGVSPLLVYQQFKAYGLQGFGFLSSDPAKLTSGDDSSSADIGVRLGFLSDAVKPKVTVRLLSLVSAEFQPREINP